MIHHVVIWRLKAEIREAQFPEFLARVQRCLQAMRTAIPPIAGLRALELGVNEVPGADAADLLLYGEFDDWEALRGYDAHPLHRELKAIIGPARSERRVVDYQVVDQRS